MNEEKLKKLYARLAEVEKEMHETLRKKSHNASDQMPKFMKRIDEIREQIRALKK